MKRSEKGTKLNEARYFRQSRPYTRKRITKMRLIPDIPGLHENIISSPKDQILLSTYPRSSVKSRDRCITLDRDQRSREIAWISYTSDSEDSEVISSKKNNFSNRFCDTFVETDPEKEIIVWLPVSADLKTEFMENTKQEVKLEAEKEIQVELESEVEEKNIGVELIEETKLCSVKSDVSEEPQEEIEEKVYQEIPQVHSSKNSNDSERSFWLRYGGIRKILDFFGHLLGRRTSENNDKESTRKVDDRSVGKSVNSSYEEKNKRASCSMKSRARSKRSNKRKCETTRKNKQQEDRIFSGLTRQIINTRDKRLRATLVEHVLRTRKLEEENRRYRRILEQKLKTRQMSSPLH